MAQPLIFPVDRLNAPGIGETPFLNRLLPAADFVTEYAFTLQSRQVANYRGSFSAVSGAADEAFPQTGVFASSSTSRAVAFFKSPTPSTTMQVFSSAAFLDSYAPVTVEPGTPNYTQPGSVVFNSADQAGPGVEYAPRADSVPVPFYAAPISQVISPMFAQVLDAWAATTFGRATPYYRGSRAITIAVYDPATNSFADWTPAALLSRSVNAYSAPKAQPTRAYDQPAAGNDYASSTLSRRVANYVGSYSAVWNAADAPAAADTWASIFASRAAQRYAAPRALVVAVYDPATNSFADWTPSALLSRRVAGYAAPLSRTAQSYDQPAVLFGTDWAAVAQGWRAAFRYQGVASRTIPVYDPATNTFADWTPAALLSRQVQAYRSPLSRSVPVYDQPAVTFGTDWASVAQGYRAAFRYQGPQSRTIAVYDPATNSFRDWTPSALTSRSVPLFRSPAAFLSRAYDQPAVAFGTTWTSVFQSRPSKWYSARSWMGDAWTIGAIAPLTSIKGYSSASDALVYSSAASDAAARGSASLDALTQGLLASESADDGSTATDANTYGSTAGDA